LNLPSIVSRFLRSPTQTIKEEQTLVKFLIVGGSGAIVNLVVSYFFHHYMQPEFAQAFGVELSIISNFVLNDSFTFKHLMRSMSGRSQNKFYRFLKYNLLSVGTAGLNLFIFYILVYPLGLDHGLWYVLSSFIAVLASFAFNYLGSSRWAWKTSPAKLSEVQKSSTPVKE
jgi:dolichol-phosphate mannosyltransferase